MSIISEFETEADKLRFIEQTIKNSTVIRQAGDELTPMLTALDAELPEPYKTDLADILAVWSTIESFSHAQRTDPVVAPTPATPSVNLQPPVDIDKLAADAAAAEINAAAHAVVDGE